MQVNRMSAHNHSGPILRYDRLSPPRYVQEKTTNESPHEPHVVSEIEYDTSTSTVSAYLGLGSNLGDRKSNILEAIEHISSLGLIVVRSSSIYETEPVGYRDQPWFLNQVVELRIRRAGMPGTESNGLNATESEQSPSPLLQAKALLREVLNIEAAMGRERHVPNGPRVIDIDLLLFGELIVGAGSSGGERREQISVPHPRMHLRRFVLAPLCEIAPDLVHPVLRKTCRELLVALGDRAVVRTYV